MIAKIAVLVFALALIIVPLSLMPASNPANIPHTSLVGLSVIATLTGMAVLTWMLCLLLIGVGIVLLVYEAVDLALSK
jgi:hypothetical protein